MENFMFRTNIGEYSYVFIVRLYDNGTFIVDSVIRDSLNYIPTPNYGKVHWENSSTIDGIKIYKDAIRNEEVSLVDIEPDQYEPRYASYKFPDHQKANEKAVLDFVTWITNNQKCNNRLSLLISKYEKGRLSNKKFHQGYINHVKSGWQEYYKEDLEGKGERYSVFSIPDLARIEECICDRYEEFDLALNLDLTKQTYECTVFDMETDETLLWLYTTEYSLRDAHTYFYGNPQLTEYLGNPKYSIAFVMYNDIIIQQADYIRTSGHYKEVA